ncbi:restriction endonuclease subunit S [Clostridium sp. HBUAS56010]|uniref:restriction endonuclease subunit S n=1 Tax=Clostridium sp. HBUAS56010 TaxID=2571127 RepID=UPI0011785B82|nr:restriction endonuclease subunit S [Clostridium sp. HBUAS56010]
MNTKQLKEFVTFIPGINPTRVQHQFENEFIKFYDQLSFTEDYKHEKISAEDEIISTEQNNLALMVGDVVISNSLQCATMVSTKNAGKVLSLNFTKIEFNEEQLDKGYFLFLFNAYKNVKYQKEKKLQGSGSILRIPLHSLKEIVIPVIPIKEQRKIGTIYIKTLQLQSELSEYSKLLELFTNEILEKSVKGCY